MEELIEHLHEHGYRERKGVYQPRTYTVKRSGTTHSVQLHEGDVNITITKIETNSLVWWKAEAAERVAPRHRWSAEGNTWAEALAYAHDFERIECAETLLT